MAKLLKIIHFATLLACFCVFFPSDNLLHSSGALAITNGQAAGKTATLFCHVGKKHYFCGLEKISFMDISSWMTGPWQWVVLLGASLLVGISKTGIQGITLLTVPLLAITFGAKPSTGLMLPLLCFADLMAVSYYRRRAEWKYILRLLPAAIAGFFLAIGVDRLVPATEFKRLMGVCLAMVLAVMLLSQWRGKENMLIDRWWYGPVFGLLGGFTTMIGNAAGPVMAVYLLSLRIPKLAFVGTNAWFFLTVNYLKIPLQVFAWHNITATTLAIDACAIPFVVAGGFLGVRLVKILPEKEFRIFTTIITCIGVAAMLWA